MKMQGTRRIIITILVLCWPSLNVVDSSQEFNEYFNFTTDPQCDADMLTQATTCPYTDSACQQSLDKSLQCRYNETLERIETLYSYTQSEITRINSRAESFRVNVEKSLENLAGRTKRSPSHVKEIFGAFATGKMTQLRDGEMSAKAQETRQEDLVFLNAFFEDVNETMCDVLSRLEATDSELADLQNTTASNQALIASVQADVASVESFASSLEARLSQAELDIDSIDADIETLFANISAIEAKVEELCDQVEKNTMDIYELFNATAVIPDILQNFTVIEIKIRDLEEQFTESLGDLENLNETITFVQEHVVDIKDNVTELWDEVNYLGEELDFTQEQFDAIGSIFSNLTEALENLTAIVLSLEEPVVQDDLLALESELGAQIWALNDTIQYLGENITYILMDNEMMKSKIMDLMAENEQTRYLLDNLDDEVNFLSDIYEILEDDLAVLNATQEGILYSLDELNSTITACCESQGNNNQTMPEPMMCCNQSENLNLTEFEDRIQLLALQNLDLVNLIIEVKYTLMEKISQLENCCSLVPANLSLEFPFPFPLVQPVNGSSEGCGDREHGGDDCGCAGKICELEKKIDTLLKKMPDCPDGYVAIYLDNDRSDFLCVRMESTLASQPDHGKMCLEDGLNLAEFPCVFGFLEFKQYIMGQGGAETLFFVGASDEILDGYWTWLDSTVPVNEAYWAPGQPDGGSAENCAAFNSTDGLLYDVDCTSMNNAFCMTGSH